MKDEEVLKKAIEKVMDNGWNTRPLPFTTFHVFAGGEFVDFYPNGPRMWLREIIFLHPFAKAFFGPDYLEHLSQMVTFKHPLDYLRAILEREEK